MTAIHQSALELIGNTPLLELTKIEKELGLAGRVVAKLEYFNPAGSVKDRIGKAMIAIPVSVLLPPQRSRATESFLPCRRR